MADYPQVGYPTYVSADVAVRHYNVKTESLNGRIQVRSRGVSRREWTLKFPPMTRAAFAPVYSFFHGKGGSFTSFTINVPDPTSTTAFNFFTGAGCETVTVRLAEDVQEFAIGVSSLYEYEVTVVEVL